MEVALAVAQFVEGELDVDGLVDVVAPVTARGGDEDEARLAAVVRLSVAEYVDGDMDRDDLVHELRELIRTQHAVAWSEGRVVVTTGSSATTANNPFTLAGSVMASR